jgi:Domain of unknown function (DUF4926)
MFTEYDGIKSRKQLNSKVPEGSLGTILIVYDSNPIVYEIEFVNMYDGSMDSLDVLTVNESDIRALSESEVNFLAERHRKSIE